jgi:hypothetical protein
LAPPLQASSKALIIKVEIVIIFISTGVVPTNLMCPVGTYENRTAKVPLSSCEWMPILQGPSSGWNRMPRRRM